jgi:hypothetical protein
MSNNRYEKVQFEKFDEMVLDHNSQLVDAYCDTKSAQFRLGHHVAVPTETGIGVALMDGRMNRTAFRQLCQRLSLPYQWLQSGKCPEDLEVNILNRMAREREDNLLWRFKADELRAVLSDKYLVYNHADFWQDIKDAIQGTDLISLGPVIWKPYVGNSMDAWMLFDNVSADPQEGNQPDIYDKGGFGGLRPAIHFQNTEDGTGRVRIDSGLFRSYCTNGVIFGWKSENAMSAEHLGKSHAHMEVKVALAIADAAATCKLGIDRFIAATQIKIKEDVINKIVEEWARVFSISADTTELWSKALTGSKTWGDVVMGTSDFAGQQEDRKLVSVLEEASGAILFADVPLRYRERNSQG